MDKFRLATPEELQEVGYHGGAYYTGSPGDITPFAVFRFLCHAYGPPNDSRAEKTLWSYAFRSPSGFLSVNQFRAHWSVGYIGPRTHRDSQELKAEATEMRDYIITACKKIRLDKRQFKSATGGCLLYNPYHTYQVMALALCGVAEAYEKEVRELTGGRSPFSDKTGRAPNLLEMIPSLHKAAFMAVLISFEAFLNVVHRLFLKDELVPMRDRLQKDDADKKLLLLHTVCYHFIKQPIGRETTLFKAYSHLITCRNNFLHGNILESQEDNVVYQAGLPFLVGSAPKSKYGIAGDLLSISGTDVERANAITWKLTVQVIKALADPPRRMFAIAFNDRTIHYIRGSGDQIKFVLAEDDFMPDKAIEEMLDESPELEWL